MSMDTIKGKLPSNSNIVPSAIWGQMIRYGELSHGQCPWVKCLTAKGHLSLSCQLTKLKGQQALFILFIE